jgi:glycosyl transferase family 2
VSSSAALDVEVTPPYLTESYSLYRTMRERELPSLVLPSTDGVAYCSERARQTGSAFAATPIVVECREPALRAFQRDRGVYLSKSLLGRATAERLSVELADAYVCNEPQLVDWFRREGWELPPRVGSAYELGELPNRTLPASIERPLISVVVPYRERTQYLPYCLEALARQSYPALEVVIADDGSASAGSLAQLREVESRSWPWPMRVLRLEHAGLGSARNSGWRAASADLITFIDDDDVAFDDFVETLWRARVVSGADVAVGGARFFHGDGEPIGHRGDVVRISLCEPRELGLISNQYGGPVNLWPRSLLERLGGFHVHVEDWDLLARATFAGARLVTPPDPVYWYRQTPDSMYSADPAAFRDAGVPSISASYADQLPPELKLVPQLAAGAYSELERRGTARARARSVWQRGRLLARRTRQVWADEGAVGVARGAARLLRSRR